MHVRIDEMLQLLFVKDRLAGQVGSISMFNYQLKICCCVFFLQESDAVGKVNAIRM